MKLGIIARADDGGLGNLLTEAVRHLKPEACLIVKLPDARGLFRPERITEHCADTHICGNPLAMRDIAWLLERCDVVYTAEIPYSTKLYAECQRAGVKLVLHAMPELLRAGTQADVLLNATTYQRERVPTVLPIPVARDRLPYLHRTDQRVLLHTLGPAMLDRNGSELLYAALQHVKTPCALRVIGSLSDGNYAVTRVGNVTLEHYPPLCEYWDAYTPDVAALVMPRRYAGLCLPAQEAASCGIPTICLNTAPLNETCLSVGPVSVEQIGRFAGGQLPVHATRPEFIARAIDGLLTGSLPAWSEKADAWAQELDWERLLPRYQEVLR